MATVPVALGIVALYAASWGVLLGGVASVHSTYAEIIDQLGLSEISGNWLANQFGLSWWLVVYHFISLVVITASALTGKLKEYSQALVGLLSALLGLHMYISHEAAGFERLGRDAFSNFKTRTAVFLAGSIMCGVCVVALIGYIGTLPSSGTTTVQTTQKQGEHARGPAPLEPAGSEVLRYVAATTGSTATESADVDTHHSTVNMPK